MRTTSKALLLIGFAAVFATTVGATEIYRWVDESGRTHMSDVVPERYKKSAIRIDSSRSELSPEQKMQAEQAAAKVKAPADEPAKRSQSAQPTQPASATSQLGAVKRPAQSVTDSTDCETWRRLYRESMECFGPYRTTKGATKPEAFEKCNPIPSPELKCGPISD